MLVSGGPSDWGPGVAMDTSFRPETYFPSPPTLRHQLLCPSIVYEFHFGLQCEQPTLRKSLWCDLLLLRFKAHLTPVYYDTQGCFTIMRRTHDLHRSKASLRWVTEVFSNMVNGIAEYHFAFSIDCSVESFVLTAVLYTLWPASLFLPLLNQWCSFLQEDSGIAQTTLKSPTADASLIKPSDIFGEHNLFVTPSTVPNTTAVSGKNAVQSTSVQPFLCPSAVDLQVTWLKSLL